MRKEQREEFSVGLKDDYSNYDSAQNNQSRDEIKVFEMTDKLPIKPQKVLFAARSSSVVDHSHSTSM